MIDDFIKSYIQKIVSNPEKIDIAMNINDDGTTCDIIIYASDADVGRIIGKNGKMISSIKTFVSACKAKDGMSYKIVVKSV